MSIESVIPSNRLIPCHPLLFLPSIFPSIRVSSNESVLRIRWQKYWSFHFSISLSNEHPRLISFRMDCLDLLAVQGTLRSFPTPQFKSINSLALSFFMIQFSHSYMTTGKTIALTRWTFVGKVMSLLFNTLFMFAIAFLPGSSSVQLCLTLCNPWTAAHQPSLTITNTWILLKLMSIELVMPSNDLIFCHLLLLRSVFPSIRIFSNESVLRITWPKYWSFSFSISPSNKYSGLTSFRIDWLDLLAVQGTLRSFPTPQFKSINSLVLSFLYCPTLTSIHDYWKNHSLELDGPLLAK